MIVPRSILVVGMPSTPGFSDLPAVNSEVDSIMARFDGVVVGSVPGAEEPATRSVVLRRLPESAVAHFACHAVTNWNDAAQSFLAIQNDSASESGVGYLRLAEIAGLRVSGVRLAVLSACGTARGSDLRRLDEAVHLVSAFMEAGFAHTVGTLWEIADLVAAEFSASLYEQLDNDSESISLNRTAVAVREASRRLRNRFPASPALWAAHIHVGP